MPRSNSINWFVTGALAVLVLLAGFSLFALDAIEQRLIQQEGAIRALGEVTERMEAKLSSGGVSVGTTTAAPASQRGCAVENVLHPEVKNLLGEQQTRWPPPGAPRDGALSVGWDSGDPVSFNPLTVNAAEVSVLAHYTSTSLASRNRFSDPDTWYGELACRVEVTDDAKEFTIYLRRGVEWPEPVMLPLQDAQYAWLKGTRPLTSQDFVFYLDMLMNPQVENGFAKNYYEDLESWKALDDYTLQLRFKKKAYANTELALSLQPLPRHIFAFDEAGKPMDEATLGLRINQHWFAAKGMLGIGPYTMTEYVPGSRIVIKRNEQFYGDHPAIRELRFPIYTDREQTRLRLKAGELDRGDLTASQYRQEILDYQSVPQAQRPRSSPFHNGKLSCRPEPQPIYRYIGWNADRPLFADARVRTAMTLAIDRKQLVERVFVGLGEVANGPFLPESGQLDPGVDPLDFDLARAAALLKAAGFVDTDGDGIRDKVIGGQKTPFEFSLLINASSPEYAALANIMKEALLKIGVKMNIVTAEWSLMLKRMNEKEFDAYTGAWVMPWDGDPYQLWHSSQADIPKGSNRVGFRNKAADRIIEELRETFDSDKRKAMFQHLHRLIYEAQAYTFLTTVKVVECVSHRVGNIVRSKVYPNDDMRPWIVTNE